MDNPGLGIASGAPHIAVATAPAPPSAMTWADRLKLAAYQVAAHALPWVPGWMAYPAARCVGALLWALRPAMRQQADAMLEHIPALAADPAARQLAVRRLFGHLVLNYLELFTVRHRTIDQVRADLTVVGQELLDAALHRGRGVVVIAAHLGDFDRAITIVAGTGVPVWLPVERLEPPAVFDLCRALRSHHGVRAVPADSSRALRDLFAALRRGEIVLMTADRDVLGTGAAVPLFGVPARLPVGPLVLAQRTGATMLGAFSWRVSGRRSMGNFVAVVPDADSAGAATNLAAGQEMPARDRHVTASDLSPIARVLETQIAAHPEQWVAAFTSIWDDYSSTLRGKDTATTP